MTTLTNQPDTDILNEGQVAEIEAREWRYPYSDTRRGIVLTVAERDALCRTLRAAWGDLKQGALCEECEQWENNEDGNPRTFMVCGACWNKLQQTNTALREQLAEVEQLAETRSDLIAAKAAHVDQLQSKLAQVEKEQYESCVTCACARPSWHRKGDESL